MDFDDYRDADDAVYEMNGRDLLGDRYLWIIFCNLNFFRHFEFFGKFEFFFLF